MNGNQACRGRVLVAEDDILFAETVDDVLRHEGFCVSMTADGQAALEAAEGFAFDVLLTDLRMPRLDGATLIRRLRAGRRSLPVVVMSGYPPPEGIAALQQDGEGPLVLLNKPMRSRVLLQALDEVLGRRAAAV